MSDYSPLVPQFLFRNEKSRELTRVSKLMSATGSAVNQFVFMTDQSMELIRLSSLRSPESSCGAVTVMPLVIAALVWRRER